MKNIIITLSLFILFFPVHFKHTAIVWDYQNRMGVSVSAGTLVSLRGVSGANCLVAWDNHRAWTPCVNLSP